jgi:MYXO-CTERM domain-containing protein
MGLRCRSIVTIAAAAALITGSAARAAILTENFDEAGGFFGNTGQPGNVPAVPVVAGWSVKNNSSPLGTQSWQSGSNLSVFPPQAGTGFALVNSNSTTDENTISNWLITPVISFNSGDLVQFFTRTLAPVNFPDRLQVRLSTNGNSTDVGTTATTVGDFTTLLLDINPNLTTNGYPTAWTLESINLPTSGTGRLAFRYFVPQGGPAGANSNLIGIDTLNVTAVPEPVGGVALLALGGAWLLRRRR